MICSSESDSESAPHCDSNLIHPRFRLARNGTVDDAPPVQRLGWCDEAAARLREQAGTPFPGPLHPRGPGPALQVHSTSQHKFLSCQVKYYEMDKLA